ncbi:hypothetical protein [Streptomyces sp. NBC_01718]|uniref:hypothetical protein n=1 Tax=Streptomyces sp. NBC_01718 TaxID=2975919 RepID=UPI00352CD3AC
MTTPTDTARLALDNLAANLDQLRTALADAYGRAGHALTEAGQSVATAEQEAAEHKEAHERACRTIAEMHAAAVGEVRGPTRGVVEDVAAVRARAERLAKAWRDAETDVTATEKRLDTHRRALAAVLAKPGETPFEELTEYAARTLTRNGARLLGAEQRATTAEHVAKSNKQHVRHVVGDLKRADATLQRVRDAETLADALAAVAEHDGLTPEAARTTANIAAAAEEPAAVEAERDRAHAIALAGERKRADNAWACASKAEAALARISHARQSADVWAAIGVHYGWTPEQAGRAARARRTADERLAEQRAAYARRLAEYYRAAYRSARDRARQRTAQRDRARKAMAAWTDHTARTVADRDQLRAALADLAHQED